jgi:hypothetical protein
MAARLESSVDAFLEDFLERPWSDARRRRRRGTRRRARWGRRARNLLRRTGGRSKDEPVSEESWLRPRIRVVTDDEWPEI